MWKLSFLLAIFLACGSCSPPDRERLRTVAALELPLRTVAERNEIVALLRRQAAASPGLHVYEASASWKALEAQSGRGTIFAAVWGGANDNDLIADVGDNERPGTAWITFLKGRDRDRAARFRQAVTADVEQRWPEVQPLPVLPDGGLALPEDLRMTSTGYKIKREAAERYELPVSSPLVARD